MAAGSCANHSPNGKARSLPTCEDISSGSAYLLRLGRCLVLERGLKSSQK